MPKKKSNWKPNKVVPCSSIRKALLERLAEGGTVGIVLGLEDLNLFISAMQGRAPANDAEAEKRQNFVKDLLQLKMNVFPDKG